MYLYCVYAFREFENLKAFLVDKLTYIHVQCMTTCMAMLLNLITDRRRKLVVATQQGIISLSLYIVNTLHTTSSKKCVLYSIVSRVSAADWATVFTLQGYRSECMY